MSDVAGVVLVSLVAHCRERHVHLARFHADDIKASLSQAVSQGSG
jgi:hypothetical protein